MGKKKKVSISLLINKKVKPIFDKDTPCYPVYLQVNYNRKNIKFRPNYEVIFQSYLLDYVEDINDENVGEYNERSYLSEDFFEKVYQKIKDDYKPNPKKENGILIYSYRDSTIMTLQELIYVTSKIVQKEISLNQFELKGLGKRINRYLSNPLISLDLYLCNQMSNLSKGLLTLKETRIFNLYRTAIDKFIFLKSKNLINKFDNSELYTHVNALFWIAIFIDESLENELYMWQLMEQEIKSDYMKFYSKKKLPKNVDPFFKQRFKHFDFYSSPKDKEILNVMVRYIAEN